MSIFLCAAPCVHRADGYDKPGASSRSAVVAVAVCQGWRERDRHRPVRGCSSAPPHDRARRRRVDDRAGRVVGRAGLPVGDLVPLATDLVEPGDSRAHAGRGTRVALRASDPGRGRQLIPRRHESVRRADRRLHDARDERPRHPSARASRPDRRGSAREWSEPDHRGSGCVHGRRGHHADDDDLRNGPHQRHGDRVDACGHGRIPQARSRRGSSRPRSPSRTGSSSGSSRRPTSRSSSSREARRCRCSSFSAG